MNTLAKELQNEAIERPASMNAGVIGKRLLDVLGSAAILAVLAPVLLVIGAVIKLTSPGPAVFRQTRVGKDGRQFTFYKFRTMVDGADERRQQLLNLNEATGPIFKMRHDPRITGVGGWLRKRSFDELPQLFNVMAGNMSLVGPRPPLLSEVAEYGPLEAKRLLVKPGLTGLWQVSGRSDVSFEHMVGLDLEYIRDWSLWLDLKILLKTVPAVISGKGAY
jgi:exopolysaccharide biosynthesis polyprenyl glycosylphosphotransferase